MTEKPLSPSRRVFEKCHIDERYPTNHTFLKFSDTGFTRVSYIDANNALTKTSIKGKWQQVKDTLYLIYADRVDTGVIIRLDHPEFSFTSMQINFGKLTDNNCYTMMREYHKYQSE